MLRFGVRSLVVSILLVAGLAHGTQGAAALPPNSITAVDAHVPPGATAVLVNITMVDGHAPGFITADKCSALALGPQTKSNGNHVAVTAVANLSVVPVDPDGHFCIYNQAPVELLVDVQGYFTAASVAGSQRFVGASPSRLLDTRLTPLTRRTDGTITKVVTGLPPGTASALVNITMVDGSAAGYVTADACSTMTPGPQSKSNGNHIAATAISNVSVVPLDSDGSFCIYNQVAVNLVVDLQGSFAVDAPDGLPFSPIAPTRVLDTRDAPLARPQQSSITRVMTGVPAGTSSVLANMTMVDGLARGYITANRCSVMTATPQEFSNGNFSGPAAIANLAVVPVDADGSFCIYNQLAVDLVVDIQGTFSASGTEQFVPVAPNRVLDTRPPPLTTTSCASVVHLGDSTSVGMISPSILPDPADRMEAQYRRVGVIVPLMEISGARSIVETLPGQVNARDRAAAIKAGGYEGCWVLALGTTDTANVAVGSGVSRRERIDRMMAVIGDDPVLWVNVRTLETSGAWSNQNMQLWNQQLIEASQRYPNLLVYDWASVASTAWFSSDRIHYTPDGYRLRARLIADALLVAYPA